MSLSVCISHWSFPICSRGKNGVCSNIPRIVNTGCGNSLNSFSFCCAANSLRDVAQYSEEKLWAAPKSAALFFEPLGHQILRSTQIKSATLRTFHSWLKWKIEKLSSDATFCTHKPLSLLFIYLWHRLRSGNIGCSINLLCLQNTARNIIYRELGWSKDEIFDTSNVNRQKQYILQLRMRAFSI